MCDRETETSSDTSLIRMSSAVDSIPRLDVVLPDGTSISDEI
jgi:hypothetical protein